MTKDKALYAFFNSFDIPAYVDTSVLNENGEPDVPYPYLTYTAVFDSWGGEPVSLTVNLWYRTESEAIPNAKAFEIGQKLRGSVNIPCDGGYIKLLMGSPAITALTDSVDPTIKRRYMNVTAIYYTEQ